jgi:hypothetical protein
MCFHVQVIVSVEHGKEVAVRNVQLASGQMYEKKMKWYTDFTDTLIKRKTSSILEKTEMLMFFYEFVRLSVIYYLVRM